MWNVRGRYVLKLRQELEELTANMFGATNEREQIKSVLSDLAKTSNDFKQLAAWALGQLTSATLSRLRHVKPRGPCRAAYYAAKVRLARAWF